MFWGGTLRQCWRVNSLQPWTTGSILMQQQALTLWHLQRLSLFRCCSNNYVRYANYSLIVWSQLRVVSSDFCRKAWKDVVTETNECLVPSPLLQPGLLMLFSDFEEKTHHHLVCILRKCKAGELRSNMAGNYQPVVRREVLTAWFCLQSIFSSDLKKVPWQKPYSLLLQSSDSIINTTE